MTSAAKVHQAIAPMNREPIIPTRALISVSDKTGIVEFARGLSDFGVELISTGGTAKHLREAGLLVIDVSDITGFPEILDGRVKTLHPLIAGGLLGLNTPEHEAEMAAHGIKRINLVCVNFYPFEQAIADGDGHIEEGVENIDIGGPTIVRAASKNLGNCVVVTSPEDYQYILYLINNNGGVNYLVRIRLAQKVFALTARYELSISEFLSVQYGRGLGHAEIVG